MTTGTRRLSFTERGENVANDIIRDFYKESGVCLWQFAELVGLSDSWFTKLFRREYPQEVQLCLVEAMKKSIKGEKYNLDAWNDWRVRQEGLAQARRYDAVIKRQDNYRKWKKLSYALDEAEKRRIEGGWDTWQ